jgi:AcrR family transcriptional regulator
MPTARGAASAATPRRRPGRPAGKSETRQQILDAARTEFGSKGYDRSTIRSVAAAAEVDPALVHHYFRTKSDLFAAAMELPVNPRVLVPAIIGPGVDDLGERLVRTFLGVWDTPGARERLVGLIRSAVTVDEAAQMMREFLTHVLLGPVSEAIGRPDARLRVTLVGAQLVGLALMRYVLELEPLASADTDDIVERLAPHVQRLLTD